MYILGINQSHTASAAILKDGKILSFFKEEQFSKRKGQAGFPKKAVQNCLKKALISIKEVDLVIFGLKDVLSVILYVKKYNSSKSSKQGVKAKYLILESLYLAFGNFPKILWITDIILSLIYKIMDLILRPIYIVKLSRELGIAKEKIIFLDHHLSHAYAGYYSFSNTSERLVITNDGSGDDVCGRVFTVKKGNWRELASTSNQHSLSYIFYWVTKILGFSPLQDESKVMNLAISKKDDKVYDFFKKLIWCEGLSFKSSIPTRFFYPYLKQKLTSQNPKVIASCAQALVEDLLCEQVGNAVKETSINEIVLSGGLANNSKANKKVAALTGVKKLLICPSPSDQSTSIGACFWGWKNYES